MSKIEKITIRLPVKSSASSYIDVNNLIRDIDSNNIRFEGKYEFIDFTDPHDERINNIVETAYKLSAFKLIINEEEVDRKELLRTTRHAVFCPFYQKCEGLCMVHLINFDYSLDKVQYFFNPDTLKQSFEFRNKIRLNNFLNRTNWAQLYVQPEQEETSVINEVILEDENQSELNDQLGKEDTLKINQDILKQEIRNSLSLQEKYCDIFDWDKIEQKLVIPDTVPITYWNLTKENAQGNNEDGNLGSESEEVDEEIDAVDALLIIANILEELPQKITESMRKLFIEAGLIEEEKKINSSD